MPILSNGPSRMLGGGRVKWYRAGGAPLPLAAYQPKGAASQAASYVNLARPGAYDAAPGVAPTWSAANGWIFNGALAQYLTTSLIPGSYWSLLIRYDSMVGGSTLIGGRKPSGLPDGMGIGLAVGSNTAFDYGNRISVPLGDASGILAIAGTRAYRNGIDVGGPLAGVPVTPGALYIGAYNNSPAASGFCTGNIQAVAIYNAVLTPAQVAAVSSAMASI